MFKVSKRNNRKLCELCSKLIKTPERCQWRRSGVFTVNFEHITYLFLFIVDSHKPPRVKLVFFCKDFRRFLCQTLGEFRTFYGENLDLRSFKERQFWKLPGSWVRLTLSWRRSLSYRNQSIDWLCKSMDWFLYDNDLPHERIKTKI